jgi:hypothetical protein
MNHRYPSMPVGTHRWVSTGIDGYRHQDLAPPKNRQLLTIVLPLPGKSGYAIFSIQVKPNAEA